MAASRIQARVRGLQQRQKQSKALVAGATHPEGVRLVALLDFKAEEEDDLEFSQGDILIGYSLEEGWWSGVKEGSSFVGDFPSNYVVREGAEDQYELELNQEKKEAYPETKGTKAVPMASASDQQNEAELPLDMMEWLIDWSEAFKIKAVEELARALDAIGVTVEEDLKDLDDEMVEEACLRLKKLDAKRFRRAIEGERDSGW